MLVLVAVLLPKDSTSQGTHHSLSLNGTNGYVNVPNSSTINVSGPTRSANFRAQGNSRAPAHYSIKISENGVLITSQDLESLTGFTSSSAVRQQLCLQVDLRGCQRL